MPGTSICAARVYRLRSIVLVRWKTVVITFSLTFQFVVRAISRRQLPNCMDGTYGSQHGIRDYILKKWHFHERLLPVFSMSAIEN